MINRPMIAIGVSSWRSVKRGPRRGALPRIGVACGSSKPALVGTGTSAWTNRGARMSGSRSRAPSSSRDDGSVGAVRSMSRASALIGQSSTSIAVPTAPLLPTTLGHSPRFAATHCRECVGDQVGVVDTGFNRAVARPPLRSQRSVGTPRRDLTAGAAPRRIHGCVCSRPCRSEPAPDLAWRGSVSALCRRQCGCARSLSTRFRRASCPARVAPPR